MGLARWTGTAVVQGGGRRLREEVAEAGRKEHLAREEEKVATEVTFHEKSDVGADGREGEDRWL
jgi:hypothetical protein